MRFLSRSRTRCEVPDADVRYHLRQAGVPANQQDKATLRGTRQARLRSMQGELGTRALPFPPSRCLYRVRPQDPRLAIVQCAIPKPIGVKVRSQPEGLPRQWKKNGAPGEIRTPDPLLRRQMLYPAELRARSGSGFDSKASAAVPKTKSTSIGDRAIRSTASCVLPGNHSMHFWYFLGGL